MCYVLRAGTELKHRKNLGQGIDGQPEPQNLLGTAQPGAQLVQLEVWEMKMAERALVQGVCVLTSTGKPSGDGGLSIAENTLRSGKI